jgi:tetratricopeptide (TPR) repeat protein
MNINLIKFLVVLILIQNAACNVHKSTEKTNKAEIYYKECLAILNNTTNNALSDSLSSRALELADKCIMLDPNVSKYHRVKGSSLIHQNDYSNALNSYDRAIELDSTNFLAWMGRGIVYKNLKDFVRAEQSFIKSAEIDRLDASVWFNLGSLYRELDKPYMALVAYDESIVLNPNGLTLNNRGNLKVSLKFYDSAISDFSLAITLDSLNKQPYNSRGFCYFLMGNYENALKDFFQYLDIPEDRSFKENYETTRYAYNNIANCYHFLGNDENACIYWLKAIESGYKYNLSWKEKYNIDDPIKMLEEHCN